MAPELEPPFYRRQDVRDGAGKPKRQRVRLGAFPAMSLAEARAGVHAARETRQVPGAPLTVAALAENCRRDVLVPNRETGEEVFAIIRQNILDAQPARGADPSARGRSGR